MNDGKKCSQRIMMIYLIKHCIKGCFVSAISISIDTKLWSEWWIRHTNMREQENDREKKKRQDYNIYQYKYTKWRL